MNGEYSLVSLFGSGVIKAVKARKIISSLLTGIGCIILFVGLAGFILPRIDNPQLKLVLSSFQEPTSNAFLHLMNNGMNLAMEHCFPMLLIGSAIAAGGVVMTLSLRTDEEAQALRQRRAAASPSPYIRPVADTAPVFQASPVPGPPADNPFARPAAATSSPDDVQPSVPTVSNPFARPAGKPAASLESAEENPFARYIPADALPKSTARKDSQPTPASVPENNPETVLQPATDKAAPAADPVPPAEEAGQSAGPDVYEAYHRPVTDTTADDETDVTSGEPIDKEASEEKLPVTDTETLSDDAPSPDVSLMKESLNSLHRPAPVSAPAPAAALSPRPLIRSTFRNSTPAQPEETNAAASGSPAPLQPSSRIKSTMGRKR